MFRKFLLLLLFMALLGVSSAFLLRELIVRDFAHLAEAQQEDRVSWVVADLESVFAKQNAWNHEMAIEDAIWALQLGLETIVRDRHGAIVMDTATALASLTPESRARLHVARTRAGGSGDTTTYPLFLHGEEIGRLEVRFLPDGRNSYFVNRTNHLLTYSALILAALSFLLSVVLARRLSGPIVRLSHAALGISQGNLDERVKIPGNDEMTTLGNSFNQMAHALQTQNKLRKQICANLAHELRTPLTVMRAQLEGMLDGVIASDSSRTKLLLDENQRLTKVVASMEDFFQAQASVLTLAPVKLYARQLLDNLAKNFEVASREKQITISVVSADDTVVIADPERLTQILVNLISNALKATESGGTIILNAGRNSDGCTITVSDSGCGIPAEELPLIFERFYRGKDGGLGLGLAIVRELMDAHGASINVASTEGAGTIISLVFHDNPETP